jgi:hypothetical protein
VYLAFDRLARRLAPAGEGTPVPATTPGPA